MIGYAYRIRGGLAAIKDPRWEPQPPIGVDLRSWGFGGRSSSSIRYIR